MKEIDIDSGEVHVEVDGLTVEEQVKTAYADAYGRDNDEYEKGQRCLTFLTDRWVEPQKAIELVRFIGPYNAFDPETVVKKISAANDEIDHLRVAVGREGSPVLYFEVDSVSAFEKHFEKYADEFGVVEPPDISNRALYREDYTDIEEHSSCRHDRPPVEAGFEEDGDPESDYHYVRAWWD